MLTTILMAVLAANEVNPVVTEEPKWSVQLSLGAPSVISTSFALGDATPSGLGGLGGLSSVTRPMFTSALTVERTLSKHWTALAAISFGASFAQTFTTTSGAGVVGARWYASRALDGFFLGPSVMAQVNTSDFTVVPNNAYRHYAVGAALRAGWLQRFGEHFMASASAGLGGNFAWSTAPLASQTLNLNLDVALAAGLLF